jgi:hypothetical protein
MSRYVFTGAYQTNVELPDGTIRLTNPGEAADFDEDPGPLWAGARTNVAKAAVAQAAAPPPAPTEPAPAAPSPAAGATPAPPPTPPEPPDPPAPEGK